MAYPAIRRRRDNVLQRLFQRPGVAIAGRDGTLVQSGATGATALHPTTGAVVSDGALISHNLPINGVGVLPMSFAQGARTNLCAAQTFSPVGLLSNSIAGVRRTITEDTSSTNHFVYSPFISLTNGSTYALRGNVYRSSGARHAVLAVARSGHRVGVVIDMDTGVATSVTIATGSISGITVRQINGGWAVSALVSDSAWGGTAGVLIALSNDGATYPGYTGDGASSLVFEAVTLEAATFSGLGLAEGATRAADNILWTPPSALATTSGEVVAVAAPYLWSANAGAAHPSGASGALFDAAGKDYVTRAATEACIKRDTGDTVNQSAGGVASLAESSGVLLQRSQYWDATVLRYYRGTTLAGSDSTLSGPWTARANVYVGGEAGALSWFGFVGLIYVPGGLTDAERTALARLIAGSITYVG